MKYALTVVALLAGLLWPMAGSAQDRVWLQIEAQPNRATAEDRARDYAQAFPNVAGFRLASGWYAIVLGPFEGDEAQRQLRDLRARGLIPRDSFPAEGNSFREGFWPPEGTAAAAAAPAPAPAETVTPAPLPEPVAESPLPAPEAAAPETAAAAPAATEPVPAPEPQIVEETLTEARRSESQLDRPSREALQTALQWFGYYNAAIDGAFGPGTRKSMAAWQGDNSFEPTGVLTTFQRATLLEAYDIAQRELGLETVTEAESGIEITLPMALVAFDHYEPPFVHYTPRDGSGVTVILISQPGDQATLYGLYDVLQTLAIMPLEGERDRRERSFSITGRNDRIESHAFAELSRGLIKGYILSYPVGDSDRMGRVLAAMRASFKGVGDRALDPGLVPMSDESRAGLMAGLEVRRPLRSRSGFFVDAAGSVLTTAEAVQGCGRITVERDHDASVVTLDEAAGAAIVKPARALAPPAVAGLRTSPARPGGEVAVAGYSYEDQLPSPTLTFGRFEAATALDGSAGQARLSLTALPGDAGGPVLDGAGAVIGMLATPVADPARQLPPDVAFALPADRVQALLAGAGITAATASGDGALAPEDLTRRATGMTVLVSCWE